MLYSLTINLILVGLSFPIWVDWDDFVRPVNKLAVILTDERKTDKKKKTNLKYYNIIMLTAINPKLPMRDKSTTKNYYLNNLNFKEIGNYEDYLIVCKDKIEIHFFMFKELDPKENYGGVYIRTDDIDKLYQSLLDSKTSIHPNGNLEIKPWGQKEFALLDPDNNLLTFGQSI